MQETIVALIVAYAAWVVAKRYMPKAIRQTVRASIVVAAKRLGWNSVAHKFEMEIQPAPACADACSTCGGCGATDTTPEKKQLTISVEALKRTASR